MSENRFNESQIQTRNVIERTFGIWKRRFPVTQDIIVASAILHNIARERNERIPENGCQDIAVGENMNVNENGNDRIHRELMEYFGT